MSGGVIIPDKETAYALQNLARHKTILQLLCDIQMDIEICKLEGWDVTEYLRMLQALLNSFGVEKEQTNERKNEMHH